MGRLLLSRSGAFIAGGLYVNRAHVLPLNYDGVQISKPRKCNCLWQACKHFECHKQRVHPWRSCKFRVSGFAAVHLDVCAGWRRRTSSIHYSRVLWVFVLLPFVGFLRRFRRVRCSLHCEHNNWYLPEQKSENCHGEER